MYHETSSVFSDESHTTKASTSSANSSRVYVFPVGRSRAQPKRDPHASKGQQSWKFSGGAGGGKSEGKRTGLMGMLLKKKTKAPKSDGSNTISTDSVASEPTEEATTHGNADMPKSYQVIQAPMHDESQEQGKRMKSRIGSYPLDPYDSVLLDNDRHTGELLARLNPTGSPSVHNYGNTPPTSVLDLGCGQGHWVVDAAIAWKGYGTKITGYDMVDVSKDLLPWVIEQGVNQNVQFIRGNFLHQRLPFSNDSFDLVRMSCLALCITSDSWIFVLQEVFRVLMVGGRLELIDDFIFFPYGKESTLLGIPDAAIKPQAPSPAPRLDITIPSASLRTFSIYAGEIINPGLGIGLDDEGTKAFYKLYGVEEEDVADTATLSGRSGIHAPAVPSYNPQTTQTRTDTSRNFDIKLHSWTRACNNSEDLEALFEHMLVHKFGINKNPSEFVLGLMKEVFGHAQEINTMHITLASPKPGMDNGEPSHRRQNSSFPGSSRRESMGLSQAPGLVLWPSTFIPMDQAEIEIHASKHLRMLLSCKDFLLEHAIEVTDDGEIDERAVLEGLEEYESFLRRRFDPPVVLDSLTGDRDSETASIQGSIAESVSSDGLDAMREIESELRPRFSWQGSPSQDELVPATPSTPKPIDQLTASEFSSSVSAPIDVISSLNCPRRDTDGPLISSHEGPTHIRTFRIYEAIKIDEAIFGSSMRGLSGLRTQSPR
ncbi:hypothetical protein M413DRAFT_66074 [Hebeloma cylindrosporum]|uniref:Methyltransferase domain-containing protein n=1 Tax=Hebeloma cylindrosporum TaxID=76867 RepID=A0A0C3CA49_HEBCY|nr:hypothetical protein M413DRAFT_66074 [Hebeloma cylindrosporum h7]